MKDCDRGSVLKNTTQLLLLKGVMITLGMEATSLSLISRKLRKIITKIYKIFFMY